MISLINSDSRNIPLADGSVNCVVTSPPYYGLRDYGTAKWEGGDPGCEHTVSGWNDNLKPNVNRPERDGEKRQNCIKCGAHRIDDQIGLEQTPDEYVAALVAVFREVWRVLRDDGTVWLNLGDSYAGSGKGANPDGTAHPASLVGKQGTNFGSVDGIKKPQKAHEIGLKPKDLIGIPWRVAFALQADGWYLRQDIIWAKAVSGAIRKGSAMPESVTDRFCKSHEYVFLLTKSARYWFDSEAVKEPSSLESAKRMLRGVGNDHKNVDGAPGQTKHSLAKPRPNVNTGIKFGGNKYGESDDGHYSTYSGNEYVDTGMATRRSVWLVNTSCYHGAHFATYPPELIEPCILAGCPEGGLVLDPFVGSGTTLEVARKHGRNGVGLDLSLQYLRNEAMDRLQLRALKEWGNGKQTETNLDGLALFENCHEIPY